MNTKELKELAELYIDNELDKSKEPLLFSSLASNDEAREYFFNLNVIRNSIAKDMQPFPGSLEERIFSSLKERENRRPYYFFRKRGVVYFSMAFAVILMFITFFLFNQVKNYEYQVNSITEQINIQNRTIDLILNNSLPPAEVRSRSINEVIVRANL